jgi:transposase
LLTDARGTPLVVLTTAANISDGTEALYLLDSIPPIQGPRGRPRFRPDAFQGDHAYGWKENIAGTKKRGVRSQLARPQDREHGSGLGKTRYVVEAGHSWFNNHRRIRLCYERTGEHFQAFHELAAALICHRKLLQGSKP